MERRRPQQPAPNTMAIRFIAVLGLMTTTGCRGSSDGGGQKDSSLDSIAGKAPDIGTAEAGVSSEVASPSVEARASDVTVDVAHVSDGDTVQNSDLPLDVPITNDDVSDDRTPPDVEDGDLTEVGQSSAGTGGTSASATGGATNRPGTGGAGGTGGTGTALPRLSGWPNTSADTPYVFGPAVCNGARQQAPAPYVFTLRNSGSSAVTFGGVSFSGAAGYSVDLTVGTSIQPGESKVVTITAPALPFPLALPAAYPAVLTLTTNEVTDNVHSIHVLEVVHGARLAWGAGASSTYLGGAAPGSSTPLSQEFTIVNTGDQATTVDITSSDPNFTIATTATGVEIPAGGSVVRTLSIIPPAIQGVYTTSIGMVSPATSNLCASLPGPWVAYAMSIAGYPEFSPPGGTFHFSGACGESQLASRTITITNVGTGTLRWVPVILSPPGQPACFAVSPSLPLAPDNSEPARWFSLDVGVAAEMTVTPLAVDPRTKCASQQVLVKFSSADADGTYRYSAGDFVYNNYYNLTVTPLGDNLAIAPSELDFGNANLLKSPPSTILTTMTLTFANQGWTDPLESDTSAKLNLTITNPAYAFDESGHTHTSITLQASPDGEPHSSKSVAVYYLRPQIGPYTGQPDNGEVEWTLDASDRSCMCQSGGACTIRSGKVPLKGQVVEAQVSSWFMDMEKDFGTVFCGATANARDLVLANYGDGPLTINSAVLVPDTYFSFTTVPPLSSALAAKGEMTFHIVPKTIPGADITGRRDLGESSEKFSTTLIISTNARNSDANVPTVVTVPLKMYAQGIIIDPVTPTTWSYQQVLWPASISSTLTVWVTNRGNVNGTASLVPAPPASGKQSPFWMMPADVPGDAATTALSSQFGGEIFDDCNTPTAAYNAPGQLIIQATDGALSGAQRQALGTSKGVCQAVSGSWVQDVTLAGQIDRTGSMCSAGQRCVPNPSGLDDPAEAGRCRCDNKLESCGLIGCCTKIGVGGICVPYANQTPVKDTTGHYPGLTGCGQAGAECLQCDDAINATCNTGVCSCTANATYCGTECINTTTNVDNCGGCTEGESDFKCSWNRITAACHGGECDGTCNPGWDNCDQPKSKRRNGCDVDLMVDGTHCGACGHACAAGQVCSNGQCGCTTDSCTDGCCLQGACISFAGQSKSACGSSGGACRACGEDQACVADPHGGTCKCNDTTCLGCCHATTGKCLPGNTTKNCGNEGHECVDCNVTPGAPACMPDPFNLDAGSVCRY